MSRIAVVGSGIAGLGAAWLLSRQHQVVLFESGDYLGGHTHTHDIEVDGRHHLVDSGFIVFNQAHYPLLTAMFAELGVVSQPTTMSFSVHDEASGLEYNAGSVRGLFCQPGNLLNPSFWRMLAELRGFYRDAPAVLGTGTPGPTLGEYLASNRYSAMFRDNHLIPMASALWSSPARGILGFPMKHLVAFMANHDMLQLTGRPQWRVVGGGSQSYVRALRSRWTVQERLATPVTSVRRVTGGASVTSRLGSEFFDEVVLACHADDALSLLVDATAREREILGAIQYQDNEAILHSDIRVLPTRRGAWAAWNAWVPADKNAPCSVSYWMNALQSLQAPQQFIVSLNRHADIDPARIHRRLHYRHPLQDHASVAAQARKQEIQGLAHTWFAGAGWGFGFHEDGLRSGVEVARGLGVQWP
ncbi:FAD-dependent oxidoreductase [Pseudoxanthomonas gei]|uniref:FAD-dependent oxidoreductase n=1 Tax=Pseudoxanthomonas gei TaxID=1383030 RepID=A0ABX0A798_9GAMM|nr:FAD-dependent oxidoreductase [Pseudoxanthomonas gei]NDK37400.1 FAD-dependent oxidoreductase [Pseudoxanthomonas gei]